MLVPLQNLIEDFSLVNADYFLDAGLKWLLVSYLFGRTLTFFELYWKHFMISYHYWLISTLVSQEKYLVLPPKHSNLKLAEKRSSKKVLGFSFFSVSMKRRASSVA